MYRCTTCNQEQETRNSTPEEGVDVCKACGSLESLEPISETEEN